MPGRTLEELGFTEQKIRNVDERYRVGQKLVADAGQFKGQIDGIIRDAGAKGTVQAVSTLSGEFQGVRLEKNGGGCGYF